jgi:hypothetical protein
VDLETASIETIGTTGTATTGAFAGCTSLKTFGVKDTDDANVVTLTGSATPSVVAANSFYGCTAITSVKINSNGAESYTGSIFSGCTGLKELTIAGATGAGLLTFSDIPANRIASVENLILDVPSMATGVYDFRGLTGLKKLTVKQTLTTAAIDANTFTTGGSFTDLVILDNQTGLDGTFIALPASVKNVTIGPRYVGTNPPVLTAIRVAADAANAQMFNVAVKNFEFVGPVDALFDAFGGNTGAGTDLTGLNLYFRNVDATPLDLPAFVEKFRNEIKTVRLGLGIRTIGTSFTSTTLEAYKVDSDNAWFGSNLDDGVLYGKDKGILVSLVKYPPMRGEVAHSFVIPDFVTTIVDGAFRDGANTRIKELTVPEAVKTISYTEFNNTPIETINWNAIAVTTSVQMPANTLKYVNFGDKVEVIPGMFLDGNGGVESITIKQKVSVIGTGAFNTARGLKTVNLYSDSLKSDSAFDLSAVVGGSPITTVTIGDNVTAIPSTTFKGANMGGVNLKGVTTIGANAFEDCKSLERIVIEAGCTSILDSAFAGCSSLTGVSIYSKVLTILDRNAFPAATATADDLKDIYDSSAGGPGHYVFNSTGGLLAWRKSISYN